MKYKERILVPVIDGPYRLIYNPSGDVYGGIETEHFKNGEYYENWIVNDFCFLQAHNGIWHSFGITHPSPPGFADAFDFDLSNVHEAENQLFHAVFSGSLRELYENGKMVDQEKLLYPQERPGQRPECWAPAVFHVNEGYGMTYSPEKIYYAESKDLFQWKIIGSLFEGEPGLRDPFVFYENGRYVIVYNENETLWYRETSDFAQVSDPHLLLHNGFGVDVAMESPFVTRFNGLYYLFWSLCDGQNGCYDNRTLVYAAPSLEEFDGKAPLTVLRGHAPELAVGEDGQWYIISTFYPENGLSMAPIRWEDTYESI